MKLYLDVDSLEVCARRRWLDVFPYKHYLQGQGHHFVDEPEPADQYLLFTCAFNQPQKERSFALIEKLQAVSPERLVVAGCLPEIYPQKVAAHFNGPVLANTSLRSIPFPLCGGKDIPVCRGCLGECTYCVDRKAVGPLMSRPAADCLADLQTGLRRGLRSFRLVGDDLGAWGQDCESDIYTLLEAIIRMPLPEPGEDFRLHLMEINPFWLINHIDRLAVFSNSRISSLQIGVQSGSDKILRCMGRRYTADQSLELITRLRGYGKRVGGHIIIGFPGETPADMEATISLLMQSELDYGFVFLYSDMEGAPAEKLLPKVVNKNVRLEAVHAFLKQEGYRVRETGMKKLHFTKGSARP